MKKIILSIAISAITVSVFGQIKVFNGGNISLGSTTAPPSGLKLQVLGNSVFSSTTASITSSAYIRGLNGYSTATTPDYTWWGNDQVGMFHPASNVIGFSVSGAERMRITSSAIQINSPGNWVQSIFINATTQDAVGYGMKYGGTDNFYVHASGQMVSQGNWIGSDINIKDDIFTIDSAMFKINAIRGVKYKLKKEKQNPALYGSAPQEYIGVIAQEVEAVAPQVVKTLNDGTKAVCYEMLVGLLIEGMKEQSQKIEQLEKDLNNCCSKKNSERGINGSTEDNNETGDINSKNNEPQLGNTGNSAQLYQNKPNPFNNQTVIEYFIPTNSIQSSILIFDMQGKLMKTIGLEQKEKGSIKIDANSLYPGMYMYSLVVDNKEVDTKRMIITQ